MQMSRYQGKSTIEEIEDRFDNDVERFSNLETGQLATIDAPLAMELITRAAVTATSPIRRVLDIGCGAGNNTLKLLQYAPGFDCHLVDLSRNMLERAEERVKDATKGEVRVFKGDFRILDFTPSSYDVIIAAAVFHHLRDDDDWLEAFSKVYHLLRPGGSFWITDLVSHEHKNIQDMMWKRYGTYLETVGEKHFQNGTRYRRTVFEYIDKEDTPRSVTYQMELLRRVGFRIVEILHKNSCFAAFGAVK